MDKNDQNEHTRDGKEYTPFEFPCYRKIGDSNFYKLIDAQQFVNVTIAPNGVTLLALGKIAPAAFTQFIQSSSQTTGEEFDNFLRPIIDKIIELA